MSGIEMMSPAESEMNIFDAMEYKEFAEGKELKAIAKKIRNANEVAETFRNVSRRIGVLSGQIESDVEMIKHYADEKEVGSMNELVEQMSIILEVFEDKKVISSIDDLATIIKVKVGTTKVCKKDIAKSLGL